MMRHFAIRIALVLFAPCLFAAQVTKVKGSSALLSMDGEAALAGDNYFALGADGKKKALIKITKIKGDKAIAQIVKGNATAGMTLQKAPAGGSGSKSATRKNKSSDSSASSGGGNSRSYWGLMVGVAQDAMNVKVNSATLNNTSLGTVGLNGIGFSALGLFDYSLFDQVWFRALGGLEDFNVSGSAKCGTLNAQACTAKIMYLSMDFIARYEFMTGSFRPWGGAGIGMLFPASKDSTALSSSSIGTTNVILVTGGFDYFISPTMYIPFSIEYGLLPKSDDVDAHWLAVRAGIGVPF